MPSNTFARRGEYGKSMMPISRLNRGVELPITAVFVDVMPKGYGVSPRTAFDSVKIPS